MSNTEITLASKVVETITAGGDLDTLSKEQQGQYIGALCNSVGLNALSRPIQLIKLNGKITPYATKGCTDQLRQLHGIAMQITNTAERDGILMVTVRATTRDGRVDEDMGAVVVSGLKGEALANAHMKAITKAKRRVTLSICGLGMLDESELETIPASRISAVAEPIMLSAVGDMPSTDGEAIDYWTNQIEMCKTAEDLTGVSKRLKAEIKDDAMRAELSKVYLRVKAAIRNGANPSTGEVA